MSQLGKKKGRVNFSKQLFDVACPDFLSLQLESFRKLLQLDVVNKKKFSEGLYNIFNEHFPITDVKGNFTLEFLGYTIDEPYYTPAECLEHGFTYDASLKIKLRLSCKDEEGISLKEEEVYLSNIPYMTPQGSFIFKGIERVLISQLQRSYGVFFSQNKHISGANLYSARIVPSRGTWIEFSVDLNNEMFCYLDRRKKLPITLLLRAMGYSTDGEILELFDLSEEVKVNKSSLARYKGRVLAAKILKIWNEEFVDEETGEVVAISRSEVILDRNTVLDEEVIKVILSTEEKSIILRKEDVGGADFGFIYNTLKKDETNSEAEAIHAIYCQFRNTEPSDEQAARDFINQILFSPKRAFLGSIGRYCINKKLELKIPKDVHVVTKEDIIATIKVFPNLMTGKRVVEDIDSMENRIIRLSGDLLKQVFTRSFRLTVHHIKEVLNARNSEDLRPADLINGYYIASSLNSFFGTNPNSQFMEQTNLLSGLAHKRRVTKLSKEGISRDRAGLDIRNVHASHYGRLCPVATPEGLNVGLITALAMRAKINPMGFIETPYKKVKNGQIDLSENIEYLSSEEERSNVIAQITPHLDKKGNFIASKVKARKNQGEFVRVAPKEVDYVDVSHDLTLSVCASLIPFFQSCDSNRTTMGSNMQRQAVPLIQPEAPIVGTGKEVQVARDSRAIPIAEEDGVVDYVDATKVVIRHKLNEDLEGLSFQQEKTTYLIRKLKSTNKGTCINLRPIVKKGDNIKKGDFLCEGYATKNGELALGRNLKVAFLPWKGYNFEDAIVISERVVEEDIFTSIHMEEFTVDLYNTRLGPEEFTADIPNVSDDAIRDLDENGIVRVGKEVKEGDILVGKITPQKNNPSSENKLLQAIFGEKAYNVKDSSLKAPASFKGTVVATKVLYRNQVVSKKQSKKEIKNLKKEANSDLIRLKDSMTEKLLGVIVGHKLIGIYDTDGVVLLESGTKITKEGIGDKILLPKNNERDLIEDVSIKHIRDYHWTKEKRINEKIEFLFASYKTRHHEIIGQYKRERKKLEVGHELPLGVMKQAKVYIAKKRQLQVGDKLSGRHGNKGVVSKIVRREDMPYHADGTPVDIVLNPLGLPSRMNIGQLKETILGWAGDKLGVKYAVPVFEAPDMDSINAELKKANLPAFGRTTLYDGLTGQPFDQKVTVGVIHILKLDHLVEDKIHARSTGPYALITQQPLGGRARKGGQRCGEMEVWALEAHGAAHCLREFLTVKSDDVYGRQKAFEAIYKGYNLPEPGTPEAFNILVHELNGLGLKVTFK